MPKRRFPHFTLEEAEVLEEFMKSGLLEGKWSFDVKLVSKKFENAKIDDELMKVIWKNLTAKRIDAICETAEDINIIEVKRVMLASGIGQLMLYAYMYNQQFKPQKPVKLWYVTYYNDPDIEEYCRLIGVKTWSKVRVV